MVKVVVLAICAATLSGCHEKSSYKPLSSKFAYRYEAGSHAPHLKLMALVDGQFVEIANGVTESTEKAPAVLVPGQDDCLIYCFSEGLYLYKIGKSSQLLDRPMFEFKSAPDGIIYKNPGPVDKKLTWEEIKKRL